MRSRYTAALVSLVVLLLLACTALTTTASAGSPAAARALAAVTPPSDWERVFADDFENGSSHWTIGQAGDAGARWRVETHGSGHVFSGEGFITTTLTAPGWTDYRVKFNVMVLDGSVNVTVRTTGCSRYSVGITRVDVVLSRTSSCTERTILMRVPSPHDATRWYTVETVVSRDSVKAYVDGALVIDYTDPTPLLLGGTVAFESLTHSHVHIDNVEVWAAPEATGPDYAWVKTGGPLGGLGYDVRARPDHPDTMLVTDAYSGVNISVDGGRTWTASNTGIDVRFGLTGDSTAVFSLTIDPHNNDVVWAGTQNRKGIFKSTDGGRTWERKDNGVAGDLGVSFRGFTVDPINSDIVYAAGEISSTAWAGEMRSGKSFDLTKGMVYKTTNGGEHWTQIWSGDNLARYIWIDPGNPDTLYVSTGFFDREAANTNVAAGEAGGIGILKSTDGGRTWRVLNQANGLGNLYVGSLFMHPTDPNILLAATGNSAWGGGGVYLTVDGGETWVQTLANDEPCTQIGAVEFSLSSPNIAYVAEGCAIHRSEDGGRTWRRFNDPARRTWGPSGVWAGFPIDIDVDPREPRRLFVNVYGGGNFISTDGGESWQNASQGYTGAQMIGVSVDPTDPATVYAGGRSGPFVSADGGAAWRGLNNFPQTPMAEAAVFAVSPGDPREILLSDSRHGRLFKSTDRGETWGTVLNYANQLLSLPVTNANQRTQEFTTIVFAPSDPRIVYAALAFTTCAYTNDPAFCDLSPVAGVHQSTDGGTTWRAVTGEGLGLQNVLELAVHPTVPDTVYAATGGKGVLKSTDGGRTWVSVNQGLSIGYARSLAIDPRTPSTVYVGTEGAAVFKSTDGGASWRSSSAGLNPNAAIRAVLVDPTDSSVVWAADYRSGVYRSTDAGKTWVQVNKGLSTRAVRDLAISADGRTLYAGTDGEGVFRLGVPAASVGSEAAIR